MLKMLVLTVKVLRAPETRAMVLTATSISSAPFGCRALAVLQRKHLGGG